MRRWFFLFSISLFGGVVASPNLTAAILDASFDMQVLQDKKVGYYLASFDPIHLGHQKMIAAALSEGHVDYLLVYPIPGKDVWEKRNALSSRQEMLASLYAYDPRVLVTKWTPKELQDRFSAIGKNIEIIGIVGPEIGEEKLLGFDASWHTEYQKAFMRGVPLQKQHFSDALGAVMALRARSFLVALREENDLSHFEKEIGERPIRRLFPGIEYASNEVRRAVAEGKEFAHLISLPVQALIKKEGLYGWISQFSCSLQKELLAMQREAQQKRQHVTQTAHPREEDWDGVKQIDRLHSKRLCAIVEKHGWPGLSLVGLEGAAAMWLLVQHQDHDIPFQRTCLLLLEQAVKQRQVPAEHYAYLLDRVQRNQGIPQVYGTQWCQENGAFFLYDVQDIEQVDQRRAKVGLCSIPEYKQLLKQAYNLEDTNFR
ncbi:MAG: DUF6624 domain-containing protein [Chlamydiota bacterium]